MGILSKARAAGIRAEIFPDAAKMKKQMSYANVKNIPFVAIVGENEMNEGKAMLKNMENGEQQSSIQSVLALKRLIKKNGAFGFKPRSRSFYLLTFFTPTVPGFKKVRAFSLFC